jgi:hypothetical protein
VLRRKTAGKITNRQKTLSAFYDGCPGALGVFSRENALFLHLSLAMPDFITSFLAKLIHSNILREGCLIFLVLVHLFPITTGAVVFGHSPTC